MTEEKIERIQRELKQLSAKQLELTKAHQQRVNAYEQQKTINQHLFGASSTAKYRTSIYQL